jgi:hypothetical protein
MRLTPEVSSLVSLSIQSNVSKEPTPKSGKPKDTFAPVLTHKL